MWGKLSPDFHECSSGKLQSPINIVAKDTIWDPKLEALIRDYNLANATLVDNGFNIAVRSSSFPFSLHQFNHKLF